MLKIAIVNNHYLSVQQLKALLQKTLFSSMLDTKIKNFKTAESYLKSRKNNHFHVVFIAVNLSIMSGIMLGKALVKNNYNEIVIYLAKDCTNMKDAFGLNVYHYVLNHQMHDVIPGLIHTLIETVYKPKKQTFKVPGGKFYEYLENILYVEIKERRIHVVLRGGEKVMLSATSLVSASKYLKSNVFVRVNNQTIVNMKHVDQVSRTTLNVRHCSKVFYISRGRFNQVQKVYALLMKSESK